MVFLDIYVRVFQAIKYSQDRMNAYYSAFLLKRLIVCYFKYSMHKKYSYNWKRGDNFRMLHSQGKCLIFMEALGNSAHLYTS